MQTKLMMSENQKINTDCFVFLLSKAYQKGHRLVQNRFRPYGLTNIQYVVLEVLWNSDGLKAVDLGKQLNIDKATLSGIIDRMTEAGWLIKKRDNQDKRKLRLFPAPKANDLKEKLISERKAANEEMLSEFTIEERILLRRLLLAIAV